MSDADIDLDDITVGIPVAFTNVADTDTVTLLYPPV
jgi:hypothetical protein